MASARPLSAEYDSSWSASAEENLTLDFGPFETVNRWRKMPDCDELVTVGPRRSKHTMVAFKDFIYVFGGDNGRSMLNDLLKFDVKANVWTKADCNGRPPAPRYNHSAVVHASSMFVFGGYTGDIPSNSNLANRNDLWEYKFKGGLWSEWRTLGPAPVARSAHGAAAFHGKLFIFAGYDGNARLNDMWQISLVAGEPHAWEEIHYTGESPPTCCNFPVAIARESMFVFSGESGAKTTNSLFRFHFKSSTWTRISTEHILCGAQLAPNRRYGHSMVASFDRFLYVFGGVANKVPSGGLHSFDLESQTWELMAHTRDSTVPSNRLFHAATVVRDAMYIFGGTVDNNIRSGEMYRFQLASFPKCTLQDDFGRLLKSEQLCDLRFVVSDADCEPEVIPAHAAIIAARCKWLAFKIRDREVKEVREVVLTDCNPKAFRLVLSYIYTDAIDPTNGQKQLAVANDNVLSMMNVYTLSVKFGMKRLEELCIEYLERSVTQRNALATLTNASALQLHRINEFCLRFITKDVNYNEIVMSKDFETIDQVLMVEIVRRRQCPHQHDSKLTTTPAAHSVTRTSDEEEFSLRSDMRRFLEATDSGNADIELQVGDELIPAHKAVLAARSAYFEGMFRSFCPPKDHRVRIAIGELVPSKQSFMNLLRYIYHGDVEMPPEDSLYLFSAPSFYIFANNRLQVYCKYNLERNVTLDNVVQILEAADHSQAHDVKRYALSLIVRNIGLIKQKGQVPNLSRELLIDLVHALAERTSEARLAHDISMSLRVSENY